jgi:hypothetical protein
MLLKLTRRTGLYPHSKKAFIFNGQLRVALRRRAAEQRRYDLSL